MTSIAQRPAIVVNVFDVITVGTPPTRNLKEKKSFAFPLSLSPSVFSDQINIVCVVIKNPTKWSVTVLVPLPPGDPATSQPPRRQRIYCSSQNALHLRRLIGRHIIIGVTCNGRFVKKKMVMGSIVIMIHWRPKSTFPFLLHSIVNLEGVSILPFVALVYNYR